MLRSIESLADIVRPYTPSGWRSRDGLGCACAPAGCDWWTDGKVLFPVQHIRRLVRVPVSTRSNMPGLDVEQVNRMCADVWARAVAGCDFVPGQYVRGRIGSGLHYRPAVWIGSSGHRWSGVGSHPFGAAFPVMQLAAAVRHVGAVTVELDRENMAGRAAVLSRGGVAVAVVLPGNVRDFEADESAPAADTLEAAGGRLRALASELGGGAL
jgi:hypothetical protein